MSGDAFARCREAVSAQEAAERYGVEVRRGWARCPLHGEKTPSLRFYPDGHFYCFGCHRGGSSIDFVAALFGLQPLEAVKRLNQDFSLGLELDSKPPDRAAIERRERERATLEQFELWREGMIRLLGQCCYEAHKGLLAADTAGTLDTITAGEAAALRYREALESWQDCLLSGEMAEQMIIFRDRKGVVAVCEKILNSTPMKLLRA